MMLPIGIQNTNAFSKYNLNNKSINVCCNWILFSSLFQTLFQVLKKQEKWMELKCKLQVE